MYLDYDLNGLESNHIFWNLSEIPIVNVLLIICQPKFNQGFSFKCSKIAKLCLIMSKKKPE